MLSALAVLHRPDVFHAAVAGAPVTDQRLYDTHYTERYLGMPHEQPEAYGSSSPSLRPDVGAPAALLLIHGLADDNVVAANTLQLSAGCSKEVSRTTWCCCRTRRTWAAADELWWPLGTWPSSTSSGAALELPVPS